MYSKLPNLIVGFHGCDLTIKEKVISGLQPLKFSTNDYDWLGNGIYFWEQNLKRAEEWAKQQKEWGKIETPAVVGAVIDLGHCLNLLDSEFIELLSRSYDFLDRLCYVTGNKLPKNEGKNPDKPYRRLDCAVIEFLHFNIEQERKKNKDVIEPFDSVRALFSEGDPIYEGAGFDKKTHIQICVRNPNCIKAYFDPIKPNKRFPMP